ncbi:alpha/beta fold hydrolase [Alkaliphilus peptidifermentans]|uniref:Pimeloyl-ACP methyl ester carboxylesterase n=1 Tax=Alkaliphilus peptidifermentans DSM 18978 TaxID=1120976 RepID=A0A1G5L0W5_9FIRM|nr:alpha/beta hydrolase [Alkaliphilus peptidifermentans]SCZ05988.1 Pimeloyl-ACP methyl ester carboxylesterase [Alkaliphilus peptidifermentans DSM 18978]
MSKIILIHGAWHNEICWKEVVDLLEAEGYEVQAITLPGNGEKDSKDVTYEDYVEYVAQVLNDQKEKVIVVGHSSAGHIMQMAIPKAKDKVEKIIFNNAWILPHGKSQFDFVPDEIKNAMRLEADKSGTGAIPIDPGFVRGMLATEASEERYNALMDILVTQPLIIMETPINAMDFEALDIPKVLLYCTKDVSVPPGAFVGMFKSLGEYPIIEVDCDHEGLFTDPDVFSKGLLECLKIESEHTLLY